MPQTSSQAAAADDSSRLQWRPELLRMARLALPVVLAELGWMLQGVVDVIMVGRLGPMAIGAVALGNALYMAPSLFGIGLLLGLDTVVSQAFGAGDFEACHRWLAQGVWIAAAVTPPLMLVVYLGATSLHLFGIAPDLALISARYSNLLLLGTLPLLLYAAARRYLQAVGELKVITLTFVVANLANWGGNYVLINGALGLPRMGVRGSALSTVLARVLMALMLFFFAWNYERRRGHPLFAHWARPAWQQIRRLLHLGAPVAVQIVAEVGAFGVATVLAGRISADALAAHQIALNYAALAYMVPLGISSAAAVAVGHATGAGDHRRARLAALLALGLGVGFMLCSASLFVLLPVPLIHVYTADVSVTAVGVTLLRLAACFAVFDAVQIIITGALRGVGLTRVPMLANFAGYWLVGIPVSVVLAFHLGYGVAGLWVGLSLALMLIGIVLLLYWHNRTGRILRRHGLAA